MTTPTSGAISFNDIATITKNATGVTISLDESETRSLLGVASGQISMSSAYNKPVSGSASYTTPGSYTYISPVYQYTDVYVAGGGGGGGGGGTHNPGIFINGGSPGAAGAVSRFFGPATITGGSGSGGAAGCGSAGGAGTAGAGGTDQGATGGAGGADGVDNGACYAAPGSAGNKRYIRYQYKSGSYLSWGSSYSITVGGGGAGGAPSPYGGTAGGAGGAGYVTLSYF